MALKFCILLSIVAFLLCPQVLTKNINSNPTTEPTEIDESTTIEPNVNETDSTNERLNIFNDLVNDYNQLTIETLGNIKTMLNDSIADISIFNGTNKIISEKISEFNDLISQIEYVESLSYPDELNLTNTLFSSLYDYLDTFNTTAKENPKIEDLLLEQTLIKNDRYYFENLFWDSFSDLMDTVFEKAEDYWDSLSEAEKINEEDFKKWLTQYKNLEFSDLNEKFEKFTELYEDEE